MMRSLVGAFPCLIHTHRVLQGPVFLWEDARGRRGRRLIGSVSRPSWGSEDGFLLSVFNVVTTEYGLNEHIFSTF